VANLTLSIDDHLLREARKLAVDRDTSVNQLVRDYLELLVRQADERREARAHLALLLEPDQLLEVGPITWTRDDLHTRR
jgi:hypothetical protein